jgi:hypothetical protein
MPQAGRESNAGQIRKNCFGLSLLERFKRVPRIPYHQSFIVGLISGVPPSWYQSQVVSSLSPDHTFLFRCE